MFAELCSPGYEIVAHPEERTVPGNIHPIGTGSPATNNKPGEEIWSSVNSRALCSL